jgi:hypothetical protein
MLELAKLIHEAIGIQSPRLFIGLCILLFGIAGGGLGWAIDKGYRIKLGQERARIQSVTTPTPPPAPGPITTGACSPVTTGNGNSIAVDCRDSDKKVPKQAAK